MGLCIHTYSPWKIADPWRGYDCFVVAFECLREHNVHVLFSLLVDRWRSKNHNTFQTPSLFLCLCWKNLHRKDASVGSNDRENDFSFMNHALEHFHSDVLNEYPRKLHRGTPPPPHPRCSWKNEIIRADVFTMENSSIRSVKEKRKEKPAALSNLQDFCSVQFFS